ncbi:DUF72 domain-containing protein [Capillimicrobium parvum]|uniref:DUF72 domain-containing protein n=1 Tax=Capillimicrobium parvum TaxID=2884022 RepID=UPI0038992A09
MKPARIGCSGWQYADWRGAFYPAGCPQRRWLEHYASVFDTVELNNTFYRLPKVDAVARWVAQTTPEFCFTVKVSRFATHMKRLTTVADSSRRLAERVEPLAAAGRMGPWLWQLPERFRRDDDRLAGALAELPPGRHALELRHASWFCDEVWDLLRRHGVAAVIGHDARRPLPAAPLTAGWTLIRFHYGARGRGGNYSEREIREWAARVDEMRAIATVFAYFNNDWNAFAPRNALALRALLADTAGDP